MPDTHIYCTQCGTQLAPGQKFCHECGAPAAVAFEAAGQRKDSDSTTPQESSRSDRENALENQAAAIAGQAVAAEGEMSVDSHLDSQDDDAKDALGFEVEDSSGGASTQGDSADISQNADDDGESESEGLSNEVDGACSVDSVSADEVQSQDALSCDEASTDEMHTVEVSTDDNGAVSDSVKGGVDDGVTQSGYDEDDPAEVDAGESVSDIDIDDSFGAAEGLQGTRPIPVVASSQVPVVSEGISTVTARPGNTTPMPLVTEASKSYAYREDTQVLDPVSAPPKQYRQDPVVPGAPHDSKRTALIAVIVVLLVALVALLGVLVFGSQGSHDASQPTQNATQTEAEPASNEVVQVDEPAEEPTSSQDRAIYNKLSTYYDHLGSYDSDISAAADDFNANYLKKSYSKRSDCYDDASRLMQEITRDYDALQGVAITSSSEYYASYNDMLTCYYDCLMRVEVICEAWENSLSYSDPSDYSDEICAPLSRDRENGTNKYLAEFEELYPDAKPAEPRS